MSTVTINPGDNVQSKVNASASGDLVQFAATPASPINLNGIVTLPPGRTYQGVPGTQPINIPNLPRFLMPQSRVTNGGFKVPSGAALLTIQDLDIDSPACAVNSSQSANLIVRRNAISAHGDHAIRTDGGDGAKIIDNWIHHCTGADRAGELWNLKNAEVSRNILYFCNQGFHIMFPGDYVSACYNVGRKLHNKLLEIQNTNGADSGSQKYLKVNFNVVGDWDRPWDECFALSVPCNLLEFAEINDNYLSTDFTGPWGPTQRFGYAIEAGGNGRGNAAAITKVLRNIMGGPNPWVQWGVSTTLDVLFDFSQCYGKTIWANFSGEAGDHGSGSIKLGPNNKIDPDASHMPPPPAWVNGGVIPGQDGGGSTQPPPPTMTITTTTDPSNCIVTIAGAPSGVTKYTAQVMTKDHANIGAPFDFTTNPVALEGLPTVWELIVKVTAGTISAESPVFKTTGAASSAYPAGLSMQPRVKGTTTPPPPTKRTVAHYTVADGKAIFNYDDGETSTLP